MASQNTITVTPVAYTSLGPGPWLIEALSNPVQIAVSDTQPAAGSPGFLVYPGHPLSINTTSAVWASTTANSATITYGQIAAGGGVINVAAAGSGGWSVYSAPGGIGNPALTNSSVSIKGSAGNIAGYVFDNSGNTQKTYVQLFDATSVSIGTSVPKIVVPLAPGGFWEEKFGDAGVSFTTGIMAAATTTPTGSAAPAAAIPATIYYK